MKQIYILNEGYKNSKLITHSTGSYIYIKNRKFIDLSNCAGSPRY